VNNLTMGDGRPMSPGGARAVRPGLRESTTSDATLPDRRRRVHDEARTDGKQTSPRPVPPPVSERYTTEIRGVLHTQGRRLAYRARADAESAHDLCTERTACDAHDQPEANSSRELLNERGNQKYGRSGSPLHPPASMATVGTGWARCGLIETGSDVHVHGSGDAPTVFVLP